MEVEQLNKLNRERETTLARLSRIAGYKSVENTTAPSVEHTRIKGRPIGTMSIDAAMGTLWSQAVSVQIDDKKDEKQKNILGQMTDYMSVIDEAKHSGSSKINETGKLNSNKVNNDEKSWQSYINGRMDLIGKRSSKKVYPFDVLDSNRSDAFLLYSYDKRGFHSTLGAGVNHSTSGFTSKI